MTAVIGTMERNVGGLFIYRKERSYYVLDCRVCPFEEWGTLPFTFNVWQQSGQLKIFFLYRGPVT
jgi:hypothetical protein